MKRIKKISVIGLTMMLLLSLFNGDYMFAKNLDIDYQFSEVLNEDKSESTITLTIPEQEGISIKKIVLPDNTVYIPETDSGVSVDYKVNENKVFEFLLTYTIVEDGSFIEHSLKLPFKETEIEFLSTDETTVEATENVKVENEIKSESKNLSKPTTKGTKFTDVEDGLGLWNYTIIDETEKKVEVNGIDASGFSGNLEDDAHISYSDVPMPAAPSYFMWKYTIATTVKYNGEQYTVTRVADKFHSNGGNKLLFGEIVLPDTITEIGNDFLRFVSSGCRKVYIPDSVTKIGNNSLIFIEAAGSGKEMLSVRLPKSASYGDNTLIGTIGLDEIIVSEAENGEKITFGEYTFASLQDVKRIELPKSLASIGDDTLTDLKSLEFLSLWNTTQVGTYYVDMSHNAANAIYLVKSDKKLNTTTDQVYKMFNDNGVDSKNIIYGITEVTTTSGLTQTVKLGDNTSFNVAVEKKIGNDSIDTGNKYDKSWIDGSYTYTIEGNTSTSTKMDGDKLTVGSDETANSIKVKAISTFDNSKFVEFTINIDKTQEVRITFDAMGGTLNSDKIVTINKGEAVQKPTDPVFSGHTFEGWYTDTQFTTEWNFADIIDKDMTLYAKWDPIVYKLSFDANGGKGTMADIHFAYNGVIKLPANTYTKIGYEFSGWNTKPDGSGIRMDDEANAAFRQSTILYAQWRVQGPSVLVEVPKQLVLKDGSDGMATVTDKVNIVDDPENEKWWEDKDILIKTSTSIELTNINTSHTFTAQVFKEDGTQHTDETSSLMVLNPKHTDKKSGNFTLKTKIDHKKDRQLYDGIMRFIIQFK